MSLFVNKQVKPIVHVSPSLPSNSHQVIFQQNYLTDLLNKQEIINQNLKNSQASIDLSLKEAISQHQQHQIQFQAIETNINRQDGMHLQIAESQIKLESSVEAFMDHLNHINQELRNIGEIMQNDHTIREAILAQLVVQDDRINTLVKKVSQIDDYSYEMSQQLKDQLTTNIQLNEKLEVHDVYHHTLMERLEQQDALSHKILFQLDNLKGILFERIGTLVEKVEIQGKLTIKYLSSLFPKTTSTNNEKDKITLK